MTKTQAAARRRAATSALGSVRAEGLRPSAATQKLVRAYANGQITAGQLRKQTLQKVKGKAHK